MGQGKKVAGLAILAIGIAAITFGAYTYEMSRTVQPQEYENCLRSQQLGYVDHCEPPLSSYISYSILAVGLAMAGTGAVVGLKR